MSYKPQHKIRIVTAASLFDGHDVAINIMRRILQSQGAEVIHLGHNRSAADIVETAIEEDVQSIAITSYQGGHIEFFKYIYDLLHEKGCGHIKIFGGGGGTILPQEIKKLEEYGIARIYSPDDGRKMGLVGMIEDVIKKSDFGLPPSPSSKGVLSDRGGGVAGAVARAITNVENRRNNQLVESRVDEEKGSAKSKIVHEYFHADPMYYKDVKEYALEHRKNPTPAEALLWEKLRNRKEGFKFRRQHIIDKYIADFVCLQKGVVIEIDGNIHQMPDVKENDEVRTARLNELGFEVLRFSNQNVLNNTEETIESIFNTLHKKANFLSRGKGGIALSSPSGGGREGAVSLVLGITGVGGAGKSTVTDELIRRFLNHFEDKTVAIISVDPSKKKTGGALLGDRIRMNTLPHPRAYMRSLATRESDKALSSAVREAIEVCKSAGFDLIILESSGIGQGDTTIVDYCDVSLYVMTPEYGAATQLEKINMLDYADVIAINKFDKAGALDALHDVRKQYKRDHLTFSAKEVELPVVGTIASQFNDKGVNELFELLLEKIKEKTEVVYGEIPHYDHKNTVNQSQIIPPQRVRYLAEIVETIQERKKWIEEQCEIASKLYQVCGVENMSGQKEIKSLGEIKGQLASQLDPYCKKLIDEWENIRKKYSVGHFEYEVRDKMIRQPLFTESLSHTRIPKIALPKFKDWGDILRWQLEENVPGEFPYTAGVFPLKREGEYPTRMFAGEGSPERTNKRFHYVSLDQPAKRLSTAFDSVTLYGENPDHRPDIYGKVGNSGVSIATVDDAKKLYSGFDLCDPKTSVSMTINGPAPIILAFFMNAAIDQQCEKYITEKGLWDEVNKKIKERFKEGKQPAYGSGHNPLPEGNSGLGLRLLGISGDEVLDKKVYEKIKANTLHIARGTVQADILKEDQAQNTCIFSTEFALKMMGDVQEYFIRNKVQNFYSVSISGYHIAEAGANPVTQLAFTLANGFTYVEYYLSRGMHIDDFAPNLSFFFSNGMDPEYAVIGRVARRIWARAMKYKYKGNERSQKLKYHIQTSGRSLHAQEIDFNDIRTTLQALYAIYDNCNSLHTNAYDEAITTPTEESVRRAMAIQLIINHELGTAKNENPNQGSFLIEELTDLVEEAVLSEFNRISERGGVLGAMERMYQRNKIQEESLYYESLKNNGQLPLIGVNTFLNKNGSPTILPKEVIRSTDEEKAEQINNLKAFQKEHATESEKKLKQLQRTAVQNGNIFNELMETVKHCSLGQITHALYEVGGQYRRNM